MTKRKPENSKEIETETGSKKNQRNPPKKRREIDVEEVNQLMSRQRNHEGDREVVKEVREKSSDGDGDDDDDNNERVYDDNDERVDDYNKPEVFQSMSKLEICTWLVSHPDILQLANKMSEMSKPDESLVTSSSSSFTDDKIRLWDESVKCLFLKARNPPGEVFDNLITKIFKIKIYTNEAKSYLERTRKFFTDFRNKFNQNILNTVEEFKEIRKSRSAVGNLSQKEVKEYIDENAVQKILSRQLVAVNISELINNGGLDMLVDFVREAIKVSWNGKNLSAIKELDRMTKELSIPSRSGSKIVNSLSL